MFYNNDKTCHYVDPERYPRLDLSSNSFVMVDLGKVFTKCNKPIDDPFVILIASMKLHEVDCDACLFGNLNEKANYDYT